MQPGSKVEAIANKPFKSKTVHSPLFSRIFNRSLNTWIESRGNWTQTQNERLNKVGGGDRLARSARLSAPTPRASRSRRSAFSFPCVEK